MDRTLRELACLTLLGEVVLDGEMVVVTPDGRADFELAAVHVHGAASQLALPNRSPSASSTSSNSATTHCATSLDGPPPGP